MCMCMNVLYGTLSCQEYRTVVVYSISETDVFSVTI